MTKARDLANAADVLDDVSATELGYVNGVTSAIQTQLNNKQAVVSGVNDTEIGYLDGVTSAIQTQLDAKIAKSLVDAKGDLLVGSANDTVSRLAVASTAGYVLTVDSAETTGLKWAAAASGSTFSGCSLYGTDPGNFEISAGASNLITWNQELFDTSGYHSTSSNTDRITIPSGKAGYYLINAAIQWDDDNAVATCGIRVYLNGTEIARRFFLRSDNGGRTASDVQVTRNLAVNDYLQVYAYTETAQGAYHYSPDARFEVILLGT
jgi:hypothetical protein